MSTSFAKIFGRNYRTSKFRDVYESIAAAYNTIPELVYCLAHGSRPKTEQDKEIIHSLLRHNVMYYV